MKIRIEGSVEELEEATEQLRKIFVIRNVIRLYQNRVGTGCLIYMDIERPEDASPEIRTNQKLLL